MRYVLLALLLYFAFRFVTRFLLPLIQVSRMAGSRMREMQKQMEDMQQANQPPQQTKTKVADGDYIEYEEIK